MIKTSESLITTQDNVKQLFNLLMVKDRKTAEHSLNVACLMKVITSTYIKTSTTVENAFMAGLLHDIGKIKMPDYILKGNFIVKSKNDWKVIELHPVHSKEILEKMGFEDIVVSCAYLHHERQDGSGYPTGCRGNDIRIEAQMLAIIDSFAAIIENRPYRKGAEINQAILKLIESNKQYDKKLLSTFIGNINAILKESSREFEKCKLEYMPL